MWHKNIDTNEEIKVQESNEKPKEESVFAMKILKPLKAKLDAYEASLRPQQNPKERKRAYPDPTLETKELENFQEMIKGTQALLEKQLDKPIPSMENKTTSSRRRRKVRSKKTKELVEIPATIPMMRQQKIGSRTYGKRSRKLTK